MIFTVEWADFALGSLATVWVATPDRNAVAAAAHAIDQTLAEDADAVGRVVFDTVREYSHPPLTVEFEVLHAERRVFVLTCWDTATGRPPAAGN